MGDNMIKNFRESVLNYTYVIQNCVSRILGGLHKEVASQYLKFLDIKL